MTRAQLLLIKTHAETLLATNPDAKLPLKASTVLSMVEILIKAFGPALLVVWVAFASAACGGAVDAPTPAPAPVVTASVAWTACSILSDDAPVSDVCASDQFVIERCTNPIPNPGGIDCVPPKGPDGTTTQTPGQLSAVWCCK